MSLFTEYEKLKTARKSLPIGSQWEVVESTWGETGNTRIKDEVYITKVSQEKVYYSYYGGHTTYYRSIETFKRTFRPVL